MIKKRIKDVQEMIQPSDFYEWTLLFIENGKFSEEEASLLTNLQQLCWIKPMMLRSSMSNRKKMYFQFI